MQWKLIIAKRTYGSKRWVNKSCMNLVNSPGHAFCLRLSGVKNFPIAKTVQTKKAILEGALFLQILFQGKEN